VELYYPEYNGAPTDPYQTKKWGDKKTSAGVSGHPQADTLGDRGEWDLDFSGGGKIYIGKFDGKIHLYGADRGAWTVDPTGQYWGGAGPARGNASTDKATSVGEVVQYHDTDHNGFIDQITYDYDGDRKIDLTVNLADFGDSNSSAPLDAGDLIVPADLKWNGMNRLFDHLADANWTNALAVYHAAWKAGLADDDLVKLTVASSVQEKYMKAYWIQERIFRKLYAKLQGNESGQKKLMKAHFLGDTAAFVDFIAKSEKSH
jgi:hypothetical protein